MSKDQVGRSTSLNWTTPPLRQGIAQELVKVWSDEVSNNGVQLGIQHAEECSAELKHIHVSSTMVRWDGSVVKSAVAMCRASHLKPTANLLTRISLRSPAGSCGEAARRQRRSRGGSDEA